MNILITSIGSNTSIGVLKELNRFALEFNLFFFGTDTNLRSECAGVKWVDEFFRISSFDNREEYQKSLIEIIEKHDIGCVIPIHDKEIEVVSEIAQSYPALTFWAVNEPSVIKICNNKIKANRLAESVGLKVPFYAETFKELGSLQFPILCKPISGVSSGGIEVFWKIDDINLKKWPDLANYFFQERIENGTEYTVDCYSTQRGEFYSGISRKRIEIKSGISTKGETINNIKIIQYCKLFLDAIKYKGASNLQFIELGEDIYFIEINPRFSGAGVLSYKANLNSPLYTVMEAMNKQLPQNQRLVYGLKMARYWEEVFFDAEGDII